MSSYCEIAPGHPYHGYYHDKEYGFPVTTDKKLFERLVLEINQAGLSWLTILKKREGFRNAFGDYNPGLVATYGETEIAKLMEDPSIIRNRLKINAVIKNAQKICTIQDTHGSFCLWIERHHPLEKRDWVKLFKKTFLFTGEQITGEFLMSIGYLPGAHKKSCRIYSKIAQLEPAFLGK